MSAGKGRVSLERGDITKCQVDAIVNAANSYLVLGGGVCNAIHTAGGREIEAECLRLVAKRGPVKQGEAVATKAGKLPAKYVIHAVGPSWGGGGAGEVRMLGSAYRSSIRVADDLGLNSIAFPSISTGTFGYPVERAAEVAIQSVLEGLESARSVRDVRFVLHGDRTHEAYKAALESLVS